jgi:hypothetical protein
VANVVGDDLHFVDVPFFCSDRKVFSFVSERISGTGKTLLCCYSVGTAQQSDRLRFVVALKSNKIVGLEPPQ